MRRPTLLAVAVMLVTSAPVAQAAPGGGVPFGSGLNTLSDFPYSDLSRTKWARCNGTDCLTPKGFTYKRIRLAEGVHVDLYNLHPNASVEPADLAARRDNISQLSRYIAANSAGNAVIVMGDTNTRYTRAEDNIREVGRSRWRAARRSCATRRP